jgi:parvulin-like peptidyl-prolyl isomerase
MTVGGCAAPGTPPDRSVAAAWESRQQEATSVGEPERAQPVAPPSRASASAARGEPAIATVDGRPIPRSRVVDTLLRWHGANVLEQLIALETAEAAATKQGLTITQADVDREYERALRRVVDPLSSVTPKSFDHEAAERLLEAVLAQRNISRGQFDLIMRRNAHVRKIVESQQAFTEEQLQQEFQRLYGKRVRVRHIQLAALREVEQVKERLAQGDDFGELAARFSANTASAQANGSLDPLSVEDDRLPELFRQTAFALGEGEVSSAVRIGEWYHLIKLEEILPPQEADFDRVRDGLARSLRDRVTEPAMFEMFEKLFEQATIRILDPVLKEAFDKRHPGRTGEPGG